MDTTRYAAMAMTLLSTLKKRDHKQGDSHSGASTNTVKNPVYQDACGLCHLAYQPDLMPAASWNALIKRLDDHFGESVELYDDLIKTMYPFTG